MQMGFWRTFLYGTAIEYGVCLALSFYFNDRDEYWYALLIMLALWAVQFAVGLKNLLVMTIYHYLIGRDQLASFIEEKMDEADMPAYASQYEYCSDYLNAVLQDEDATREQIIFAAELRGLMDAVKSQGLVAAWRIVNATNRAIDVFAKKRKYREQRLEKRRAAKIIRPSAD